MTTSYDERVLADRQHGAREQIWKACLGVATAIGGEPIEQSADALEIYNAALCIVRRRYGDEAAGGGAPA